MTLSDEQRQYFQGLDEQRKIEWLKGNSDMVESVLEPMGPDELIEVLGSVARL